MTDLDAVFLDRDGVLNRERKDYVKSWAEFEWLASALPTLRRLASWPAPIFVITNQSVIGRGIVAREVVDGIHAQLQRVAKECGGRIDKVYVCPHHPDEGCACRKPAPGLLRQAAAEHQLDLARCVFVGDAVTDALAADAAGCRSILVRSGRQGDRLDELVAAARQRGALQQIDIPIVSDLAGAFDYLNKTWPALNQAES